MYINKLLFFCHWLSCKDSLLIFSFLDFKINDSESFLAFGLYYMWFHFIFLRASNFIFFLFLPTQQELEIQE